jgi:alkyldihydroxyacetonephosphate synthase
VARVHVFTHVSHVYRHGASIYTTLVFPLPPEPDAALALWAAFKHAASTTVTQHGGTISHQHGVGVDHLPYLEAEKGALGLAALRALAAQFDPAGIMNPGKLFGEA